MFSSVMREIIELGFGDIWERAPSLPFEATQGYYLLKSGEAGKEEFNFHFCLCMQTHIYILSLSLSRTHVNIMHAFLMPVFSLRVELPLGDGGASLFDVMLLHP